MSWNVSISSEPDCPELTAVDRQNVDRRLAYSLSRYSDRLLSVGVAIDRTTFPGGSEEYCCDLQGEIAGHRSGHNSWWNARRDGRSGSRSSRQGSGSSCSATISLSV